MLLVVEVMVESSSPVCSLSAACNELTSPDSTAVFSWTRQRCQNQAQITSEEKAKPCQIPLGFALS